MQAISDLRGGGSGGTMIIRLRPHEFHLTNDSLAGDFEKREKRASFGIRPPVRVAINDRTNYENGFKRVAFAAIVNAKRVLCCGQL